LKRLTPIQGWELVRILCNKFSFSLFRKRRNHNALYNGRIHVRVPIKGIRGGLLNAILKDCGISPEDFIENL
jgi:hypothetical protein